MIPVLLHMCFHGPYHCTILRHLSYISDHPLAHLPVPICPAGQLSTVRDPEPAQSVPELTGSQPGRWAKKREKTGSQPPRLRHSEGAPAPDLSVDSKVTWMERRKARGIFNRLRLKFFGKQDKGKRIQFPRRWISVKEPEYKKIF